MAVKSWNSCIIPCIYSFCSIELSKTKNTCSLTAVSCKFAFVQILSWQLWWTCSVPSRRPAGHQPWQCPTKARRPSSSWNSRLTTPSLPLFPLFQLLLPRRHLVFQLADSADHNRHRPLRSPPDFGKSGGRTNPKTAIFQLRRHVKKIHCKFGTYLESAVHEFSKNHP